MDKSGRTPGPSNRREGFASVSATGDGYFFRIRAARHVDTWATCNARIVKAVDPSGTTWRSLTRAARIANSSLDPVQNREHSVQNQAFRNIAQRVSTYS